MKLLSATAVGLALLLVVPTEATAQPVAYCTYFAVSEPVTIDNVLLTEFIVGSGTAYVHCDNPNPNTAVGASVEPVSTRPGFFSCSGMTACMSGYATADGTSYYEPAAGDSCLTTMAHPASFFPPHPGSQPFATACV